VVTGRRPAMSYSEYLQKYYGDSSRQSSGGGDVSPGSRDDVSDDEREMSYLSDGCVDYDTDHR